MSRSLVDIFNLGTNVKFAKFCILQRYKTAESNLRCVCSNLANLCRWDINNEFDVINKQLYTAGEATMFLARNCSKLDLSPFQNMLLIHSQPFLRTIIPKTLLRLQLPLQTNISRPH
jgi:hypothetical protein